MTRASTRLKRSGSDKKSCAASRSPRRRGSPARSPDGRRGRRAAPARAACRQRSRIPRWAFLRPRALGSTQTCWSCTRVGVHADASALNRIVPSSDPEPGTALADLRLGAPAKAVRVATSGSMPISSWCAAAHAGTSASRSASVAAPQAGVARLRRMLDHVDGLPGTVLPGRGHGTAAAAQSSDDRALLADQHPRTARRRRARERAAALHPTARRSRRRGRARQPAAVAQRDEPAEPAPRDVFEEDALDRILRAEGEDLAQRGLDESRATSPSAYTGSHVDRLASAMPIHLAPSPATTPTACLLPGDPLRAKYIAETFFDDSCQVNARARDARLHGHLPRQAGLRPVDAAWAARRPRS